MRREPLRSLRRCSLVAAVCLAYSGGARAQISFSTAIDLALKNSPRVKIAEADVAKALAVLEESRDVYIPSVAVGAGLGQSYGYSPYPPTLFTFTAQSLVYNGSQYSYIRSARAGFNASRFTLQDVRAAVTEDAALIYAALDHDQRRQNALQQQSGFAERLAAIVQDRLTAGLDTQIDFTSAQLSAAQIRLNLMRAQDELENDRTHLANLIGIPSSSLRVEGSVPSFVTPRSAAAAPADTKSSPAVAAAFANAKAKQNQAFGDSHYIYRPQVSLVVQYNRYATFTNSFKQLQALNPSVNIGANEEVYGVQITLPLFDKLRGAKARESAADAAHALQEARGLEASTSESLARVSRTMAEQQARTEVAVLEQQLAQQQLDALLIQVAAASSGAGQQMTPKDEQKSRIAEREKYLAVLDATYQMQQTQISYLRQTGQLDQWLRTVIVAPVSPAPPGTAIP